MSKLKDAFSSSSPPPLHTQVGCGAGNTVFPILQTNTDPNLFIYCCDFAESAVEIVKVRVSLSFILKSYMYFFSHMTSMIRLDVMHSSTTLGHMTSPSHFHHNRLTSSFSSSCCQHFSLKSKQAFITKCFASIKHYANFASVDHFATIKSQKPKLSV